MLDINKLTLDYEECPIGVDNDRPIFGWRLAGSGRAKKQSVYRIRLADSPVSLEGEAGALWDTGEVRDGTSQHIVYEGAVLQSRRIYYWKVKVWDEEGNDCGWSETSSFETGFMAPDEWSAGWIADPARPEPQPEPDRLLGVPVVWDGKAADGPAKRYFRLTFLLPEGELVSAKLEVFAADALHVYVEGQDEGLYYPYMQAVTLDVTDLLGPGKRTIAGCSDGERKGFIAALAVTYADGSLISLTTAADWKCTAAEEPGWTLPGFDDSDWREADRIGVFGSGEWEVYKRILYPVNRGYGPCPQFSTTFHVSTPVVSARLYATALGVYRANVNGSPVGSDALAPGWTDYRIRIPYQTYDVTSLLQRGDNVIDALVGPGWYAGHLGICGPYHYGTSLAFRAELHIQYSDGSTAVIGTGEQWRVSDSPVLSSDIYMGETYDARRAALESPWRHASLCERVPEGRLEALQGPAIKPMLEIKPKSVAAIAPSTYLIDMGQNMTGWIRLAIPAAEEGAKITVRYGERLGPDGRLYRDNLRTAKQTDAYIAAGTGPETYEPLFTYHGFQFVEIQGYPGAPDVGNITGIVIHSALADTGELKTSHPLVNRLLDNIRWSQRGNFIGIPLDCPQRDERLGWTGDAHLFARTATYNMNCAPFYRKWMTDIRDAQARNGAFPDVAPFVEHFGKGHVFFADGGVIMPWTLYKVYGDRRFIEENYESMRRYIAFLVEDSDENLVRNTESFGDHLAFGAETPKPLMNLYLFAYSVSLMIEMAGIMGDEDGRAYYSELFRRLKRTFAERHVDRDFRIEGGAQTAYVLALKIGLLPEEGQTAALGHLVADIEARDGHLTTGFMGAGYVLPVLTELGEHDLAARLLLQESFPSWLYPVRQGATTVWERWDGWTEDKGFQDPEMNSFNHFALGSVAEWLYRYLAGIDLRDGQYGFKHAMIRPLPASGFTAVQCKYDTLYGEIISEWHASENEFELTVEIPANTTADVFVPAVSGALVQLDGKTVGEVGAGEGWQLIGRDEQTVKFAVGSGRYAFRVGGSATCEAG